MAERFTFPQTGDNDDAEHFASLVGQLNLANYVENGMDLQNYDATAEEIDITTGKCFVSETSAIASSSGDTILRTNNVVQVPATTNLTLATDSVNEIYVNPDLGTDDNGSYAATTTGVPASGLKIGEVDTTADTVNQDFNREPKITIDTITDRNGNTVYDGSTIPASRMSGVVEETGDTMTGDLNMSAADITFDDGRKLFFGNSNDVSISYNASGYWQWTDESASNQMELDEADGDLRIGGEITENASI